MTNAILKNPNLKLLNLCKSPIMIRMNTDGNHMSNVSVEKMIVSIQQKNHQIKCINLEKNCVNKEQLHKKGFNLEDSQFKL